MRVHATRANAWLVIANARYWRSVAPLARAELREWKLRAHSIADEHERAVALAKLEDEGFNAEVAATLAVFAPKSLRPIVVRTIVAAEVLYDYLDGFFASPSIDVLHEGEALFAPFLSAFAEPLCAAADEPAGTAPRGYAEELAHTLRGGLAQLPSTDALLPILRAAARRTADGQIHSHAIREHGPAPLERWAAGAAAGSALDWQEFAAGAAASVLAVHALIAAAAHEQASAERAAEIDHAYLMISAISTMLDSVNDYERDMQTGRPRAIDWYGDADLAARISDLARRAIAHAARLPDGPRHCMIAAGVIAYYASPPEASSECGRPIVARIRRELRPLVAPTLAIMRAWRTAKRLRAGRAATLAQNPLTDSLPERWRSCSRASARTYGVAGGASRSS